MRQHQETLPTEQRPTTVPEQGRPRPDEAPAREPRPEVLDSQGGQEGRAGQADREQAAAPGSASAPAPAGFSRLPSLTGLRWLAAFIVFCYHIGTLGVIHSPVLGPQSRTEQHWETLFSQGDIGVAFFFILSGFVLTWVAKPGDSHKIGRAHV